MHYNTKYNELHISSSCIQISKLKCRSTISQDNSPMVCLRGNEASH